MDLPAPAESFDERIQRERIDAPWGWDTFAATIGEYEGLWHTFRGADVARVASGIGVIWVIITVNRIKSIKRQMYGRAKFDLLRTRILNPA